MLILIIPLMSSIPINDTTSQEKISLVKTPAFKVWVGLDLHNN